LNYILEGEASAAEEQLASNKGCGVYERMQNYFFSEAHISRFKPLKLFFGSIFDK
jgi:hypothetical protein